MQNSRGENEMGLFQDQGPLGGIDQRIEPASVKMLRSGAIP